MDDFGTTTTEKPRYDPGLTKPKSFEDLYGRYPIGKGTHYMKVTRLEPAVVGTERVAGFLEDVFEPLTHAQFGAKFGGGKYRIEVIGPKAGAVDSDGNVMPMTLETLTVQQPGAPVLPSKGMMMNGMPTVVQGGEAPEVARARLEIERERERSSKEESKHVLNMAERGHLTTLEQLSRQNEAVVSQLREQHREVQKAHAEERARLATALEERDKELTKLREELVQTKTNVQNDLRIREQDIERRLREVWEKQVSEAKEAGKEKLDDAYRRSREDMDRFQRDAATERERMRSDAERSERVLKETSEARLRELERELERYKADSTSLTSRELESARQMAAIQVQQAQVTAAAQIESVKENRNFLQLQYEALKLENSELRRTLDETRAKMHKSPHEYINETIQMAETLGYERSEGGGGDDDKEEREPTTAEKFFSVATQAVPAIMNQISSTRAAAQKNAEAAVQQTRHQMAQRRRAQPRQMMPGMVHPMTAASLPRVGLGADSLPPPPAGPVVLPPPPLWDPNVYAQPAPQQPSHAHAQLQPSHAEDEAQQQQQQQPPPQASQPPAPQEIPTDANQQLSMFYSHISSAYDSDVEPAAFAASAVAMLGKERVAALVEQIPAKEFIRMLKEGAGDQKVALLDLGGQKYVMDVWAAAKEAVA